MYTEHDNESDKHIKITNYNTNHTNNTRMHFNILFYYISKFDNSYFVYFVHFVYFIFFKIFIHIRVAQV